MQPDIWTYSSQYTEAGLAKETTNCDSWECHLPRKSSACYFGQVCRNSGSRGLVLQGVLIIEASPLHSDIQHSVGLLWTSDQPDAETCTWQHVTPTRDSHPCPGGTGTHSPNKRGTADPRLRQQGHWEHECNIITKCNKNRSFTRSWFTDIHFRTKNLALSILPSFPFKRFSSL